MIDLKEIRRIAKRANQDGWEVYDHESFTSGDLEDEYKPTWTLTVKRADGSVYDLSYGGDKEDLSFVSKANPKFVTELIDELEDAREKIFFLKGLIHRAAKHLNESYFESINRNSVIGNELMRYAKGELP